MIKLFSALVFVALTATACSASGSVAQVSIPSSVVADDVVVPADVMPAFQQLSAELDSDDFDHWRLLNDPRIAAAQPLVERRAFIYRAFSGHGFGGRDPDDTLYIQTLQGSEAEFTRLFDNIAEQIDFLNEGVSYDNYEGTPDNGYFNKRYQTATCTLRSKRALSLGELAWIVDWMLVTYPDKIHSGELVRYMYPLTASL